jgi:hypothetical protein
LNANFITSGGYLSQPISAIASGKGTILVGDSLTNGVFEYNLDGSYKRTLVDATASGGGHVKGIDIHDNALYAILSSGTYAGSVQKYDLDTGARIGTWAAGFTTPNDIHFRANDVLISDRKSSTNSVVASYGLDGVLAGNLVVSDGVHGINYPYGIQETADGHVLVGGFAQPAGLYEYDAVGNQLGVFGSGTGRFVRGGYRLDNGNTFYTAFNDVTVVNKDTLTGTDLLSAGNFQFVHRASLASVPEPGTLSLLGLGLGFVPLLRRRR